jgi:hypothetical protein
MVSPWQADTKDTLPADTINVFCSSVSRLILFGHISWRGLRRKVSGIFESLSS